MFNSVISKKKFDKNESEFPISFGSVNLSSEIKANPLSAMQFNRVTFSSETLGSEINSGTLVSGTLYKVTAEGEADTFQTNKAEQSVTLTYAASGSSGIVVANNAHTDFGTGNFTLVWKGSLPDWTATINTFLIREFVASANQYAFYIDVTTGKFHFYAASTGATTINKASTNAPTLVDGTIYELACVVTRETALVAGSVSFYINGVLFETLVINAGTPPVLNFAASLEILGAAAVRYAGTCESVALYNRALSTADVLDLYINGVATADQWGSQTPVYTSDFSAGLDSCTATNGTLNGNIDTIGGLDNWLRLTLSGGSVPHRINRETVGMTIGKKYRVSFKYYIPSANAALDGIRLFSGDAGAIITDIQSVVDTATSVSAEFTATAAGFRFYCYDGSVASVNGDGDVVYVKDIVFTPIGATLDLEPEGIRLDKWWDASINNLDAAYPAAGCTPDVDLHFISEGTETCDANNKVKQVLTY